MSTQHVQDIFIIGGQFQPVADLHVLTLATRSCALLSKNIL